MPEDANENLMIKEIALKVNPDLYASRKIDSDAEKSTWSSLLPIFYYNDPMFPGQKLSLHLFEPRYRIQIKTLFIYNKYIHIFPYDRTDID